MTRATPTEWLTSKEEREEAVQREISKGAGKRNASGTVAGKQHKNEFGTFGECAVKSSGGKTSVADGQSSEMMTYLSTSAHIVATEEKTLSDVRCDGSEAWDASPSFSLVHTLG